jgi:2-dehydro-3-deoxy-D-arabinonate dehydratase
VFIVRYVTAGSTPRVGVVEELGGPVTDVVGVTSLAELLGHSADDIRALVEASSGRTAVEGQVRLLPPVDGRTEVWASGVTYLRSRDARVEESTEKSVYEKVYDAERPELFFKSVAWRVLTDGEPIGIRADSGLDVPEPELAVVANSAGSIVGYLVCNDVSSRSIEGENPLYLPQAKVYAGACAISAGIRPAWEVAHADDLAVTLTVTRDGAVAFSGETATSQMRRALPDLVEWLYRGDAHPAGVVLTTGTGIIPELDFTLTDGDEVAITVAEVGTLTNPVVVGAEPLRWLTDDTASTMTRGTHA